MTLTETMNLSSCTNWLCSKRDGKIPNATTEYQSVVASAGPGPSPGSSNSCDDVVPPAKNCYRLVMLGEFYV